MSRLSRLILWSVLLLNLPQVFAAVPEEVPTGGREGVNSVSGIVLAVSDDQISLLQYDAAAASFLVRYYRHDTNTMLADDPALAPGATVEIECRVTSGDDASLQPYVQRIAAAKSSSALPIETEVEAAVAMVAQLGDEMSPEAGPLLGELLAGEPDPVDGGVDEASGDTDKFSFGKVLSVSSQGLTVREFDFAKDADVEVDYQLLPETEYGNLSEQRPLRIGDDVVLDYREQTGQRFVTTLVREAAGQVCHGRLTAIIGSDITVETYCRHVGHVPEIFQLMTETEYVNLTAERSLQLGDQVEVEYEEEDGLRLVQTLIRKEELEPDADAAAILENDLFGFGKVVSVAGGVMTLNEYDFAQDSELAVTYQLSPETEYGNISSESPLQSGDRVVVDYREEAGFRLVKTLVREQPPEPETEAPDVTEPAK